MFRTLILAALIVCYAVIACAYVCRCADKAPKVDGDEVRVAAAYAVLSLLSIVMFVRYLALGAPDDEDIEVG